MHARFRWFIALAVVMALILTACGDDDDDAATTEDDTEETTDTTAGEKVEITGVPGVTDDEIRFAAFGTNSNNPLGTCVLDCYLDGIKAYFEFRNSEGGIYGRDLVVTKELDDELGKNQQRALEVISANDTFAAFSATQVASGWGEFAKEGIPLYVWNIHPAEAAHPNIFGETGVICITCLRPPTAWMVREAGAKKVASLGYGISENSKKCAQTNVKSIEHYSDDIGGAEAVYTNENLAFGLPNGVGPEVTAMKNAGVDFVFACIDLNGMKTIAQELERQGMGDVPMYHANTYDHDFVKAAGDLFEGDYVGVWFRPFEAEAGDSMLDEFKKWMDETGSKITEISMRGWINAHTAYESLKAAGPQFDRAKVIAAANEKLVDYTAGGLIPPTDYARQHEPADDENPSAHGNVPDCFAFVQIKGGEFEIIGDPAKPWQCWPGDTREWSEPEPMNFE